MAKKSKKTTPRSKKSTSRTAKSARKPAKPARKAGKKAGPKRSSTAPLPVKTGRGPTPREIADAVVANLKAGRPDKEIWDRYWSNQIESVEGEGQAMAWRGRRALQAKSDWYMQNNTLHSVQVEGPFVGAAGFSIKMIVDAEERESGVRRVMEEIGVYTVSKGKVVREEFMYGPTRVISQGRGEPETMDTQTMEPELVEA
jgi:hypothetical protein